jgi:hypothetical protein
MKMPDLQLITSILGVSEGKKFQLLEQPRNVEKLKLRINWEALPIGVTHLDYINTKIEIQGSPDGSGSISGLSVPVDGDGAVIPASLKVGSTPENVAFESFPYRINGINYNKAASAAGVVFTAAHKIAVSKFGAIAVNINASGTINTQINSTLQTDTLSFDDAKTALENVQKIDFPPPPDYIRIGYILIANNGVLWTATTDDLVDGIDVTTATFYDTTSSYREIETYDFTADDALRMKGTFFLAPTRPNKYIRLFLKELTGDVKMTINADFIPEI